MTVYKIPNIEHCKVVPLSNGRMFKINSHEGWYIHLNDGIEGKEKLYKTAVALLYTYPFQKVEIIAKENLPEDYEVAGNIS